MQAAHTKQASSMRVPSIADYAQQAQARLHADIWHYLAQGDNASNQAAFAKLRLIPRPLSDVRAGHTRLELFGQALEHPILLAPIAYQTLFHADGEAASAMAASAQGSQMLISSLASMPIETIVQAAQHTAAQATQPGPWFQLYWQGDRPRTAQLLQRAIQAGCSALVFTVDAPIKPASLQLPPGISAVNLPASGPSVQDQAHGVFDAWMQQAPRWDDLLWLRQQTNLPLLLKGILHADDAQRALDAGCDGLVVSNHGGRVLPGAVSSLQALPALAAQIAGRMPLILDSGIRSGRDIFIAHALGASAVLLGRPAIWGLATNGALGVAQVIRLLRDELEMCMALCGCADLAAIAGASVALE